MLVFYWKLGILLLKNWTNNELSIGLRFRRSYIYVAVIFNIKVMHYVKKKLTQAYIV